MAAVKISLITPAHKQSRAGNRTTAVRWRRILERLGHRVSVELAYDGAPADAMVALHSWRSAGSIRDFHARYPDRPLMVCLTGTDAYRFIHSDPEVTIGSLERADVLIGLHDLIDQAIPDRFHGKLRVIHQSSLPLARRLPPRKRSFDVCVIGHLREEKDPFRAAYAVRGVPADSRLRVIHLGKEHEDSWAAEARAEMARNPRYDWRGEVPGAEVRRLFQRVRLMVISSRMEGGANIVSEAIVAGVPVIGSDIAGNIGLLGPDYPGYYPVEDTAGLSRLLLRAEREPGYLAELARHCAARAPLFRPEREAESWRGLMAEIMRPA